MRILFSGGGTIGSVSPLIAIYEEINSSVSGADFLWLATKEGTENSLISSYGIPIKKISSGKMRRYFSWRNFLDPFLIVAGFFQALKIIWQYQPSVVMTAGGFVSVPVAWAAWVLGKPVTVHQQDIRPGLANKLMAPVATIITVTFKKSLKDFPSKKTTVVGNPVRKDILTARREEGYKIFNLDPNLPTLLVIGGGTGALSLNNLVVNSLPQLVQFCQVIHLTGGRLDVEASHSRYRSFDFLTDQLRYAYAVADLVITRAGMSSLTELAAWQKPLIVVPIPETHQEENAAEFFRNNAAVLINEKDLNPDILAKAVRELLDDKPALSNLSRNITKILPPNASRKIVELIL
ncbi:MAG: undecaprenyldiphospho-muramoylpentapeptide beta-N-acetylglucosaminyltransferase [Candidatus Buchananbacteria bacterium]|nr:undecaprenyldiphospho-muramoylpentapeptide beta-N-acetylglucosaminyltransferase [Candidatus Buchananbacteria bacterium]